MKIDFYKSKDQTIILTLTRSNSTTTWSKLRKGIEDHDLAHYVVESKLGFKNAFFGLIEMGTDIDDFSDKLKQPDIGIEAQQVEFLVNLLQTEYWNAGEQLDIRKQLNEILKLKALPMIKHLDDELISSIRKEYHEYIFKLKNLKIGESLKLEFALP